MPVYTVVKCDKFQCRKRLEVIGEAITARTSGWKIAWTSAMAAARGELPDVVRCPAHTKGSR